MTETNSPRWNHRNDRNPLAQDEGGLRAPPGLTGWRKAWWWFDFIILVKLARLRFIAVLVVIGVVITQWDLLSAHYDKWTRPKAAVARGASDVEWFCPMHPSVVRDNGKEKCPICFMPLSKRKKGETHEEALPPGVVNRVQLSPYRVVLAGVRTWNVDYQPLKKEIQAVGFVEFNERGLKNISARVKGRIDVLEVNETGQMVEAGDVLASLYSPDLNVTVQNLVDAKRRNNGDLLKGARRRLELLGISNDQIEEILRTEQANTHLKIRTPITGHVIKKYVREGQYVEEGMPLYDVADLSTVWIEAQVYEDELAFLPVEQEHKPHHARHTGIAVTATTTAFPNEVFRGDLTLIYPHVDAATRTATVRFELGNPGHKLRPGSTAAVRLEIAPQSLGFLKALETTAESSEKLKQGLVLAVPEDSVIDTGKQTIVYRQTVPGSFEGVLVKLGPKMQNAEGVVFFPVLQGLVPGDQIVTSGSFLVDAETRLNPAAGSIYFGGSGSKTGPSTVTTVRPSTPEDDDAKVTAVLAKLSAADRALVAAQKFCPILPDSRLGTMGVPVKLDVRGEPVFVCCSACKAGAFENPEQTLTQVHKLKQAGAPASGAPMIKAPAASADREAKYQAALAKLPAADRMQAEAQRFCPVLPKSRLGSMGPPVKVLVSGKPVFLCCEGCRAAALASPEETAKKVEHLKQRPAAPAEK
jgi:Cu(I)/Ag(I) efflux system membrane fusion protein